MSIVVAFSADEYGRAVLDHAARLAHQEDNRLVIVNATRGDSLHDDSRFAGPADIEATRERLAADGLDVAVRDEVVPDVDDAVIEAATEEKASLIVVGIRRRTQVGKLIMGSVAHRVILHPACPVLTVRPTA